MVAICLLSKGRWFGNYELQHKKNHVRNLDCAAKEFASFSPRQNIHVYTHNKKQQTKKYI